MNNNRQRGHTNQAWIALALVIAGAMSLTVWTMTRSRSTLDAELNAHSKTDQLIEQLMVVREKEPKSVRLPNRLGEAFTQKGRETGDLIGYNRGDEIFHQALKLDANDPTTLHNLAWSATIHHKFDDAIRYAEQAVKHAPRDDLAYGLLADSYFELGDYEQAEQHAQQRINLHPELGSYSRGAQFGWVFGNVKGATWLMHQAVEAGGPYPENTAWARTQLGDMYFKSGNLKAAEQTYKEALQTLPDYRHALAGMGRIRMAQNQLDEAIQLFEKATVSHLHIATVIELGDLYLKAGRKADAEKQYARVEPVIAEHLKHHVEGDELVQAMSYLDHDRHLDKALLLAESASKEHKSVQAYITLAWAYYKHNRLAEAERAIQEAMKWNTQEPLLFYRAGKIYQALGNPRLARKYLFAAVSLNPNFHPLYAADVYQAFHTRPTQAVKGS